jgi:hypothetical protein
LWVTVVSLVVVFRQVLGSHNKYDSIWAEDGWVQLCVVAKGHGSCLDEQVNGYWPIVHRLIAELLSLLPLSWWPAASPLFAALLLGALVTVTFGVLRDLAGSGAAVLGSAAIVLSPSLGMEFINVLGNVHWILLMAAMFMLIRPNRVGRVKWNILMLVFVASLSNPAGFVLILLVVVLRLVGLHATNDAWRLGGVALAGWITQAGAIVLFGGTQRVGTSFSFEEKLLSVVNSFLGIVPGLRIDTTQSVSFLAVSTRLTSFVSLLALVLFLLMRLLDAKSGSQLRALASLGFATQALALFLMLILDPNPRYLFVIIALNSVWVAGMIGLTLRRNLTTAFVLGALILMALPGFAVGPYRSTPSEVSWREQIRRAQTDCSSGAIEVELFFAPERSYPTVVKCSRL